MFNPKKFCLALNGRCAFPLGQCPHGKSPDEQYKVTTYCEVDKSPVEAYQEGIKDGQLKGKNAALYEVSSTLRKLRDLMGYGRIEDFFAYEKQLREKWGKENNT